MGLTPVRWYEEMPERWRIEVEEMARIAPDLVWSPEVDGTTGGGWAGTVPVWPFERARPAGLSDFLDGVYFQVEVRCSAAHPIAVPAIHPVDPTPDLQVRTHQEWHVMGDGSLCLFQSALDWTGRELVAELVAKAAGWFLEFLLLRSEQIEGMTISGIATDDQLDSLFVASGMTSGPADG